MALTPISSRFAIEMDSATSATGDCDPAIAYMELGSCASKIKQADLKRQQANVELSFAQRRLLADLRSFYDENRHIGARSSNC